MPPKVANVQRPRANAHPRLTTTIACKAPHRGGGRLLVAIKTEGGIPLDAVTATCRHVRRVTCAALGDAHSILHRAEQPVLAELWEGYPSEVRAPCWNAPRPRRRARRADPARGPVPPLRGASRTRRVGTGLPYSSAYWGPSITARSHSDRPPSGGGSAGWKRWQASSTWRGRAFYGLRRQATALAPEFEQDARVLNRLSGHADSNT